MTTASSRNAAEPLRHGRYTWEFSGYDGGEAWLDISRDQGGYLGCGHADAIEFSRDELVAVLARLDAEVASVARRSTETPGGAA